MNSHAPLHALPDTSLPPVAPRRLHLPDARRPLTIAIGAVVLWVLVVVASEQLWQRAFGFTVAEAWALSLSLLLYIALLIGVLGGIALVAARDGVRPELPPGR